MARRQIRKSHVAKRRKSKKLDLDVAPAEPVSVPVEPSSVVVEEDLENEQQKVKDLSELEVERKVAVEKKPTKKRTYKSRKKISPKSSSTSKKS